MVAPGGLCDGGVDLFHGTIAIQLRDVRHQDVPSTLQRGKQIRGSGDKTRILAHRNQPLADDKHRIATAPDEVPYGFTISAAELAAATTRPPLVEGPFLEDEAAAVHDGFWFQP